MLIEAIEREAKCLPFFIPGNSLSYQTVCIADAGLYSYNIALY